jgi:hypothetical protein
MLYLPPDLQKKNLNYLPFTIFLVLDMEKKRTGSNKKQPNRIQNMINLEIGEKEIN